MPRILVLFASTHGHTEKIARAIADALRDGGATVMLARADADPLPTAFDGVVVGASIHRGHHQREVVDWARRHHTTLRLVPSAFFSVCLAAADDSDESRAATRRYIDELVEATGWTPTQAVTFAGALQYREYDFATRLVMRVLMHKGDHPSDVSRDYDFTDWDEVERFARGFGSHVEAAAYASRSQPSTVPSRSASSSIFT
jgi:menaquinone-dependent protoporphyrinogen oxidase